MKKIVSVSYLFVFSTIAFAQNRQLDSLQLKEVVYNKCTPVKDQANSSTCWSFAGNSLIESELMKKANISYDLSEMFIARYSYIRKIKQYLKLKGDIFFTPGGQFHDIQWVIKNYGMVPEEAYNGKPNGELLHDHAALDTVIKHFTDKALAEKKLALSAADSIYINEVLDNYLGKVPKHFIYKRKKYTPLTYAKELLHFNAGDYIEITSYTHHPYYTSFVLEDKYNWTKDSYYNVPLNDFSDILDHALAAGYTAGWDGASQANGFSFENGLAITPDTATDIKAERQKCFENHSGAIDHMMHIIGLAKDKDGNKWYLIKNSWGSYYGPLSGYMYMQDKFLLLNTPAIIVNKNTLPGSVRKKLKL